MSDLEDQLRTLNVAWPPAPELRIALAPRRRRRVVVAVALAVSLATAFAVPQSRSAILRFFHLGGVTVVQVDTLPPAQERPLSAGLGQPVDDAEAERTLGVPFQPDRHGTLYGRDGFVSTVLPGPVLLSEFGSPYLIKKVAVGKVEYVEVAPGVTGLWIAGRPHVVFFPDASPRLAGNVLVWIKGNVTFRLEGRGLDEASALRLARELIGTRAG
jgi:hypothetical protein